MEYRMINLRLNEYFSLYSSNAIKVCYSFTF